MSEEFDPYYHWLKIESPQRPVDYYQLLGLMRFERDDRVISTAADQRMANVRTMQSGPRGSLSQKLLNELSAARVCLLNPVTKGAYDAFLLTSSTSVADNKISNVRESDAIPVSADSMSPVIETPNPFVTGKSVAEAYAVSTVVPDHDFVTPRYSSRAKKGKLSRALGIWGLQLLGIAITTVGVSGIAYWMSTTQSRVPQSSAGPTDSGRSRAQAKSSRARSEQTPIVINQQGNGTIILPVDKAEIHGAELSIVSASSELVTSNWTSKESWLSWQFRMFLIPKQGIFKAFVIYSAPADAAGGSFILELGDKQKLCPIRPTEEGEFRKEEFRLAADRRGEHTLVIRPQEISGRELMVLKRIELVLP